ncbi:MAG: biotin-dependent carboxyltransferase [Opitutaceae bacterium]|jgi:antagonist of KipI|nr:biotin-dependent carboxyltransferase [Opitutaceae bacterium]
MIEVLRPGILTTVQDLGRPGWRSSGVPVGGALDAMALRVANAIVGNDDAAAGLECTVRGPVLRFSAPARVALAGAAVDGINMLRELDLAEGAELSLESIQRAGRAYLAIAGGIDVPRVLGSRSTHLAGGFGGLEGRALRVGDRLAVGRTVSSGQSRARWSVSAGMVPDVVCDLQVIHVLAGPQYEWFDEAALQEFWGQEYVVMPMSDRMGLRLSGEAIRCGMKREMISTPVALGSLQVPPDGQPIVLLADCQTLGGYPQISTVISADIPKLARLRPRQRIRFEQVSLVEAQYHRRVMDTAFAALRAGLAEKLSHHGDP